jgi:hypothetical protein
MNAFYARCEAVAKGEFSRLSGDVVRCKVAFIRHEAVRTLLRAHPASMFREWVVNVGGRCRRSRVRERLA